MEHERIIYILEYLRKNTNENRTASIKQTQSHLDHNYNMQTVSPLTIRRDIERLTTMGYPITIKKEHIILICIKWKQMVSHSMKFDSWWTLFLSTNIFLLNKSSILSRNLNGSVRNQISESSSAAFRPMT